MRYRTMDKAAPAPVRALPAPLARLAVAALLALLTVAPPGVRAQAQDAATAPGSAAGSPAVAAAMDPDGSPSGPQDERKVYVERLDVAPSALLSEAEIAAIRARYEGAAWTVEELLGIPAAFDALYAAKGYLATAYLPEQDISRGVVRVELLEARIGRIYLEGLRWTREEYVLERLGARPGDLVNLGRLDEAIKYFNRTNTVKLRADLAAGEDFGTTDVTVYVQDTEREDWHVVVQPPVGRGQQWHATIGWQNNSLSGMRDPLSLVASVGGAHLHWSVSYQRPYGIQGRRVGLTQHVGTDDIVEPDGDTTPIHQQVTLTAASLSQPLAVTETTTAVGSLEIASKHVTTYVSGAEQIDKRIYSVTASHGTETHGEGAAWALYQSLRGGSYHVSVLSEEPVVHFFSKYTLSAQGAWYHPAGGSRWVARATLQYALSHDMPTDEMFHLSGAGTVRGVRSGAGAGEHGYAVEVEYRRMPEEHLELYAFADHAAGFMHGPGSGAFVPVSFTSVGVGVDWRPVPSTVVSLAAGFPLGPIDERLREPFTVRVQVNF
mgnify:CR=1 FL=1